MRTGAAAFATGVAVCAAVACTTDPEQTFLDDAYPVVLVDGGTLAQDAGPSDSGFVTAAHLPWPSLRSDGGPVLATARVVSIVASNGVNAASYFAFADGVPSSQWWHSFYTEYGVGIADTHFHLTGAPITQNMDISALVSYVQATLSTVDGGIPLDGTNVFLVYLPPGSKLIPSACGYHTPYPSPTTSLGDSLAAVADDCAQLLPTETDVQRVTQAASHELAESVTDPLLDAWLLPPASSFRGLSAWQLLSDGAAVEVGDLCEGHLWVDANGTEYQRIFSVRAAALGGDPCVPATGEPYFESSPAMDLYGGFPGTTVSIPVTGWSTDATAPWSTNVSLVAGTGVFSSGATGLASFSGASAESCRLPLMQNGATATLNVTIPADAGFDDWGLFLLYSARLTTACVPAGQPDAFHFWPVGVYVE